MKLGLAFAILFLEPERPRLGGLARSPDRDMETWNWRQTKHRQEDLQTPTRHRPAASRAGSACGNQRHHCGPDCRWRSQFIHSLRNHAL